MRSVVAQECNLTPSSLTFDLTGLSGISFVGSTPKITRLASDNPMLKILKYGSPEPPQMQVADGKLIVTSGPCLTTPTSGGVIGRSTLWTFFCVMATSIWNTNMAGGLALLSVLPMALADLDACENVLEVEIHGPEKSEGAKYMEREIRWLDYDASEGSLHFEPEPTWGDDVEAVRAFRETASGGVYNYRNKVLMGMAQTSVLNEPPEVTPKDAVEFDIPTDVVLPATNEEIMMLSVLEMQGLLRSGELTSTQLTTIALEMLDKYDPEFNMVRGTQCLVHGSVWCSRVFLFSPYSWKSNSRIWRYRLPLRRMSSLPTERTFRPFRAFRLPSRIHTTSKGTRRPTGRGSL